MHSWLIVLLPIVAAQSDDNSIQAWEIALACGSGGLALLLFVYSIFVCRRNRSTPLAEPSTIQVTVDKAPAATKPATRPPAATKPVAATKPAVRPPAATKPAVRPPAATKPAKEPVGTASTVTKTITDGVKAMGARVVNPLIAYTQNGDNTAGEVPSRNGTAKRSSSVPTSRPSSRRSVSRI